MKRFGLNLSVCILGLMMVSVSAQAQDDTITDPAKGGADYAIQGEYVGDVQGNKYGAQVIALGDGTFRIAAFKGGLPGEGWKRGGDTRSFNGKMVKGIAVFDDPEGGDGTIRIAKGVITVAVGKGAPAKLKKVTRKSSTLGKKPPQGAVVLFDGKSADKFEGGKLTKAGHLMANTFSKQKFGDCTWHIEFRTPFKAKGRGQGRGNSGVYINSMYELQVLDSFGLDGKNNECGGIYSIAEPAVNMCFPPLTWQTYDITFTAARYEGDKKVKNARATILHNGVVIHDDLELTHGTPGRQKEGPGSAPLYLQGHGNPVVYRNIWVVQK